MLENYKLLVVSRNGDDIPKIMENYNGYENSIEFATINPRVLSSTIIREHIKENEEEKLEGLINPKVLEYIKIKGLYKS
jgi:nicotinic acid mononucleotide adenylyltransferase